MANSDAIGRNAFAGFSKIQFGNDCYGRYCHSDGHDYSHPDFPSGYSSFLQYYFFHHHLADVHVCIETAAVFGFPLRFIDGNSACVFLSMSLPHGLILLHGNEGTEAAGQVIKAFGTFVVGGNYVVGLIVFLVLVLINFVVITKGATRVAEVAARFTLDAMPGKQMSIDADLNAGLITDTDARRTTRGN